MIQDFRSAACPEALAADVCIIGGGPAGISLAADLSDSGWTVCLLEGGGPASEPASQALNEGESVGPYDLDPATCRLRALGGATRIWGGGCIPLSSHEMARRDWVQGDGWPISWDDLAPYYARAGQVCGIEPGDFEDGNYRPHPGHAGNGPARALDFRTSRSRPLDFGLAYRQRLQSAPGVHVLLHANLLRLEATPGAGAVRRAVIGSLDGRVGQVTARCFVLAAGGLENARLLLLSDNETPHGLGNGHDQVGRYFMDHPRCLLGTFTQGDMARLAGLYSAPQDSCPAPAFRQLSLSADAQRAHGLLHARVRPFAIERDAPPGLSALRALRASLRRPHARDASAHVERRLLDALDDELPQRQAIPAAGHPARLALRTLLHADDVVRAAARKLAHRPVLDTDRIELVGYFEQTPNRDSRITLSDHRDALGLRKIRVDWRLNAVDEASIRTASVLIGQSLVSDFGGRFDPAHWLRDPTAALPLHGTAHHLGTTRMSESPADGVVDRHCRVHGIDNLYVAGSSVFPTGGWSFPTLTIVALALRLGDELRHRLPTMPMVATQEPATASAH